MHMSWILRLTQEHSAAVSGDIGERKKVFFLTERLLNIQSSLFAQRAVVNSWSFVKVWVFTCLRYGVLSGFPVLAKIILRLRSDVFSSEGTNVYRNS